MAKWKAHWEYPNEYYAWRAKNILDAGRNAKGDQLVSYRGNIYNDPANHIAIPAFERWFNGVDDDSGSPLPAETKTHVNVGVVKVGRPRSEGSRKNPVIFYITERQEEIIRDIGGGNRSEGLRRLIDGYVAGIAQSDGPTSHE